MPLITTHNYFAKDLLKIIPKEIQNTIIAKQNIYELFSQGFDPFIFYEFLNPKKYNLQGLFHEIETDTFFLNFIKNIKKEKLENEESIIAAIYGQLSHYILDSTCHPFIIYKTGIYNKEKKSTYKYKGLHTNMEMQIDAYLYKEREQKEYKNFKIHKHLITKEKFNPKLIQILNKTYEETFKIQNGGTNYQNGCKKMYYAYKFLIEDKTGLKMKIYHLIDKIFPNKKDVYAYFSNHVININTSIFNLEHKEWLNPWDDKLKSTNSFFDLYNKALKDGKKLFIATHNYMHNKISEEEYKKILKDNAYTTGLSWHIKKEIKNLEF